MNANDKFLEQDLARSKGKFMYGPMIYQGYVNDTIYLHRGQTDMGDSYDVTPTVEIMRFSKKNNEQLSSQRRMMTRSVQSDD